MSKCKFCGIDPAEDMFDANKVSSAMMLTKDWNAWHFDLRPGETAYVGPYVITKVRGAEPMDYYDYYEGQTEDISMVFKVEATGEVGDVRYFIKRGASSSFDGLEWYGFFMEVQPKTKTVTYFE